MRMGLAIAHRGPDDAGIWCDADAERGACPPPPVDHRPLGGRPPADAVADPAASSWSTTARSTTTQRLRARARRPRGPAWRGHSDTEALLAAFEPGACEATLKRVVGMFAFAVWDRRAARADAGARPARREAAVLRRWQGGRRCCSAPSSRRCSAHPRFPRRDRPRCARPATLRHNYIPAPHSIYRGIHKLPPGTLLQIDASPPTGCELPTPVPYWRWPRAIARQRAQSVAGASEDGCRRASSTTLLRRAVAAPDDGRRAARCVPVRRHRLVDRRRADAGADQRGRCRPSRIGFRAKRATTRRKHAKAVARTSAPTTPSCTSRPTGRAGRHPAAAALLRRAVLRLLADPHASWCRELARRHVTVSLSGDAADELFGGYTRYLRSRGPGRRINRMPASARRLSRGHDPRRCRCRCGTASRCRARAVPAGARAATSGTRPTSSRG